MKKSRQEILGGRIHRILNKTLWGKLSGAEYRKLIRLIDEVFKMTYI